MSIAGQASSEIWSARDYFSERFGLLYALIENRVKAVSV
jgi:hypothetical protein